MHAVVMFEPSIELAQHAGRIRPRADPRVIPFEGFDEGFSHTVGLGALDRRRAGHQADVSRQSTGVPGGVGRAVVRQPLNRLRQFVDKPEAALDALDHQVADIGAVDAAAGSRPPGDRLAVAAVEGEGDAHLLAVVAADLEPVRAPSHIGAVDRDPAIVPPFLTVAGMAVEQKAVHLHDPVDPLHVHGRTAPFAPLTPEQRMDAPITIGRLTGYQRLDLGDKLGLGVWATTSPPPAPLASRLHGQIGAAHAECIGNRLHGVPSRTGEVARNSRFFGCTRSSASRRISFSRVFLPSSRCSSRTWCCNARYSEAGTTSSPAPIADSAPWA